VKFKQITARSFTSKEELSFIQNYLNSISPKGVTVDVVDIKGPPSPPDFKEPTFLRPCYDLRGLVFVAPLMLEKAEEAEREGYDAVIYSCVWDPCIFSAKSALNIPVIGMTETMFRLASLLGDKWGLITGIPPMKAIVKKEIQAYGVADRVVALKTMNFDPYLDFKAKKAEVEARFIELAKEELEEGAELIVTVCSPLWPALGREALERVRKELGVVVIEAQETALRVAELLVNLGLSHSKITYPAVGEWYKRVQEHFDNL